MDFTQSSGHTREGSYGIHFLYLDNGLFKQVKVPRSEMAPPNSVKACFTINENNIVYPVESQLKLKVGQTIAFIPNDDNAKDMFDSGNIRIYTDKGYPPVRVGHSNEISTGNYYTFDQSGVFHFLLQEFSNTKDSEPTFTVMVEP